MYLPISRSISALALTLRVARAMDGRGADAKLGVVHRLDKETSGCLVVAKNDSSHQALAAQFAAREVEKVYHALACGEVRPVLTTIFRANRMIVTMTLTFNPNTASWVWTSSAIC